MRTLGLDEAVELTRTGDVWVFRGASIADRAIRALTNAPVNHVGMAVVLEDMPPLLWHAELGRSLPDAWTGEHQRGVQLHDLRDAVVTWRRRYGQSAWLRQLVGPAEDGGVTPPMEDAVLRTIARLDGKPFPTTRGLVRGWVNGRLRRIRPFTQPRTRPRVVGNGLPSSRATVRRTASSICGVTPPSSAGPTS